MTNTSVDARVRGYLEIGVGAKLRHGRWSPRRGRNGLVVMKRMWRSIVTGAVVAVAFACVADSLPADAKLASAAAAAVGEREQVRSLACTVKRIHVEERRLDVIVGVGHSLRLVRLELGRDCVASAGRQRISLRSIRPGDIIRANIESTAATSAAPSRRVVTSLDVLFAAPAMERP
jgi:hypothetical protein